MTRFGKGSHEFIIILVRIWLILIKLVHLFLMYPNLQIILQK